jgi:hypothetical protein
MQESSRPRIIVLTMAFVVAFLAGGPGHLAHLTPITAAEAATSSASEGASRDDAATILSAQLQTRLAQQGGVARHLRGSECWPLLAQVPTQPIPTGASWRAGDISSDNPYLTPQERWCLTSVTNTARTPPHGTASASRDYPGTLPIGAHAVQLKDGSWQICF